MQSLAQVTLHLNNSPDPLPFAMKVGEAGEAFFVLELGEDEANGEIPDDLVTSPIISAASSPVVIAEEKSAASKSEEEERSESLDDNHHAPRKFIAEDYVEPLDLGASRAATSQYLNSDLESNETSTIRSGATGASVDTGATSPSLSGVAGEAEASPEKPAETASKSSSDRSSSVLGNLETVASKASGAIGAAGRSVVPSLGSSKSRNAKLEKVVDKERKQDRLAGEGSTGAEVGETEGETSAHEFQSERGADGVSRMQRQDADKPTGSGGKPKTEMETLEAHMRERAEDLVATTVQAREEKRKSASASLPSSSPEQEQMRTSADLMEESYPAPFGGSSSETPVASTETAPTTQPDHATFLAGKRLEPVESGVLGKSSMHPAQVDSRTIRGRLKKWEEEKKEISEHAMDGTEDRDTGLEAEGEGQAADDEIATKAPRRKEDLQYMLDMDGYKMTADGEDLAFAEGNRFSDELPLSKRHGGSGRNGHSEVLNRPHQHTVNQMALQKSGDKPTIYRRGSLGDAHPKPASVSIEGLKRRGSTSAATSESGAGSGMAFDGDHLSPLLHFGDDANGKASEKERDALNLSRDLVRLTRFLRPVAGDEDVDELPKRRVQRRQHAQDVSYSDTEADMQGEDGSWKQPNSAAIDMAHSSSAHGRLNRATSEQPTSHFGDESPPIIRDDAALGRSPEFEWAWGQLPKRERVGAAQLPRRQRILSNPEMPEDAGSLEGRASTGRLTCDDDDPYKFILALDDASHTFELSLCYVEGLGGPVEADADTSATGASPGGNDDWLDRFEENKVSYQRFLDDEGVVNDERVVIRYNERFLTWENSSAVLATLSLYRRTLSMTQYDGQNPSNAPEGVDISQPGQSVWRRWWNRNKDNVDEELGQADKVGPAILPKQLDRAQTDSVLEAKAVQNKSASFSGAASAREPKKRPKTYAKTLRLTSDQLKTLNLRKGANTITFSVTSSYSGVATCSARIFLWDGSHQIVVSDIDGTITKSDALGHVFTMIGRDWTHVGVAKLYTDIARNGYRIMYLTSRAIGQADTTRDYLRGIRQKNYKLPDGPVIMSPDRLMASLHREVILRKPEVFKMACLRDIARLFGADPRHALPQPGNEWPSVGKASQVADKGLSAGTMHSPADGAATHGMNKPSNQHPTPFYAGFGNRITDALSYRSVNIPSSRIFTIDSNGEVKMELLELAGYKSSYIHMTDLVDQMFPPITLKSAQGNVGKPEFNDFNYWRPNIGQFELPSDDELLPSPAASSPASPALSARSVKSNASVKSGASIATRDDNSASIDEGGSRLSRFGLGKLGLSRRGSSQTIASPASLEEGMRKVPNHSTTMPDLNTYTSDVPSTNFTQTPSSPSSYGSGVTSWAAGWRRRAVSPGANNNSGVQATSPLVGPVITADPEEEDSGEGEEDDDVSSFGGDEGEEQSTMGDEVLEDDDPLLATGEIQFEWRG